MDYKDSINPSMKKTIHKLHPLVHIYFQSLSLKYHCFFSQKNTYLNIKEFPTKKDLLQLSTTSHHDQLKKIKLLKKKINRLFKI